jgi:hypothetical protein
MLTEEAMFRSRTDLATAGGTAAMQGTLIRLGPSMSRRLPWIGLVYCTSRYQIIGPACWTVCKDHMRVWTRCMILDLLTIFFLAGGIALLWLNLRTGRDVIVTHDEQQRDNHERELPRKQETPL